MKGDVVIVKPSEVRSIVGKYMLADGFDVVMDLDKSHGSYFYDSERKREMLDFFTCFASSPVGYNHPKLRDADFLEKIKRVAVNKPSNSDVYTVELAEFVDTFAKIARPSIFEHLFFVSGGALAVENGLKTAFDWKIRKNHKKGIKGEKGKKVIHFEQAFHGRTGYTLSLTNTYDLRKTMYFTQFDWPRFKNPKMHFPVNEEEIERVSKVEQEVIKSIKDIILNDGSDIAAMIIEPIQGEGGDNHFRGKFLKAIEKLANENDIMFELDEVQSGMGLTGKMWCYEHFGLEPDIIAFGKKTQVCGIMAGKRVNEVENNVFEESSRINSTWGGNLVDMVRCQRYLEIIEEDKLVLNAHVVGKYLLEKLQELSLEFKDLVSNVRGRGLMIAFDLPDADKRDKVFGHCFDKNLLVLKCGEKTIRFRPPLNLSKQEADAGINIMKQALKTLKENNGRS